MSQMLYPSYVTTPAVQTFAAYIQDNNIYRADPSGAQVVGVIAKEYDELRAGFESVSKTCKEYYDKLVELGAITPQLTQDEIIRKQAEQLAKATEVITQSMQSQKQLTEMLNLLTKQLAERTGPNELASPAGEPDTGNVAAD